uniref:Uncharacterized protein n=1 Tax=Alexandrium catenella TaxID=2925 RepID=A0A7S1WU46_ALECA
MAFDSFSADTFHPCFKRELAWLAVHGFPFKSTRAVVEAYGYYIIDKVRMGVRRQSSGVYRMHLNKQATEELQRDINTDMHKHQTTHSGSVELGFVKFGHEDSHATARSKYDDVSSQGGQSSSGVETVSTVQAKTFGSMIGCFDGEESAPVPISYGTYPIWQLPFHTVEALRGTTVSKVLQAHSLAKFLKGAKCSKQLLSLKAGICYYDGKDWMARESICNDTFAFDDASQQCQPTCRLHDLAMSGGWIAGPSGTWRAGGVSMKDSLGREHPVFDVTVVPGELAERMVTGSTITLHYLQQETPFFLLPEGAAQTQQATCNAGAWQGAFVMPVPRRTAPCAECPSSQCIEQDCRPGNFLTDRLWSDCEPWNSVCGANSDTQCGGHPDCMPWQVASCGQTSCRVAERQDANGPTCCVGKRHRVCLKDDNACLADIDDLADVDQTLDAVSGTYPGYDAWLVLQYVPPLLPQSSRLTNEWSNPGYCWKSFESACHTGYPRYAFYLQYVAGQKCMRGDPERWRAIIYHCIGLHAPDASDILHCIVPEEMSGGWHVWVGTDYPVAWVQTATIKFTDESCGLIVSHSGATVVMLYPDPHEPPLSFVEAGGGPEETRPMSVPKLAGNEPVRVAQPPPSGRAEAAAARAAGRAAPATPLQRPAAATAAGVPTAATWAAAVALVTLLAMGARAAAGRCPRRRRSVALEPLLQS